MVMLAAPALACTPSCCNYCQMTFVFEEDCSSTYQALYVAAADTDEFERTDASSNVPVPFIDAVHTTVSKCCPPFWKYYEDVSFKFPNGIDVMAPCDVIGYSKSRSGLCDLGNDERNLKKLADASGVPYS